MPRMKYSTNYWSKSTTILWCLELNYSNELLIQIIDQSCLHKTNSTNKDHQIWISRMCIKEGRFLRCPITCTHKKGQKKKVTSRMVANFLKQNYLRFSKQSVETFPFKMSIVHVQNKVIQTTVTRRPKPADSDFKMLGSLQELVPFVCLDLPSRFQTGHAILKMEKSIWIFVIFCFSLVAISQRFINFNILIKYRSICEKNSEQCS